MSDQQRIKYGVFVQQKESESGDLHWEAVAIDLPGCVAASDDLIDLFDLMSDAQDLWIETAEERDMTLPEPTTSGTHSGKVTVRMPGTLHDSIAVQAKVEGVSLNQWILTRLSGSMAEHKRPPQHVEYHVHPLHTWSADATPFTPVDQKKNDMRVHVDDLAARLGRV